MQQQVNKDNIHCQLILVEQAVTSDQYITHSSHFSNDPKPNVNMDVFYYLFLALPPLN